MTSTAHEQTAAQAHVALTGLEQLRALIASGPRPGIAVSLDFDLIEVEARRASATTTLRVIDK